MTRNQQGNILETRCMKATLFIFLFLLFTSESSPVEKIIHWKKLKTENEVRAAFDSRLTSRPSQAEIYSLLLRERHDFVQVCGDSEISFISTGQRAAFLISRKWLLRFHFKDGVLSGYTVAQNLTGP
jgi:hypothetical protein